MNYKISFRTWKKFSDRSHSCSDHLSKKLISVDIEVDEFFEVTSEEEVEVKIVESSRSNANSNRAKSMTLTRSLTKRIQKEKKIGSSIKSSIKGESPI